MEKYWRFCFQQKDKCKHDESFKFKDKQIDLTSWLILNDVSRLLKEHSYQGKVKAFHFKTKWKILQFAIVQKRRRKKKNCKNNNKKCQKFMRK